MNNKPGQTDPVVLPATQEEVGLPIVIKGMSSGDQNPILERGLIQEVLSQCDNKLFRAAWLLEVTEAQLKLIVETRHPDLLQEMKTKTFKKGGRKGKQLDLPNRRIGPRVQGYNR